MTVLEVKHQGKLQAWQERIMDCRSSGKTVKMWCREQGISVTTYYRWEREVFSQERCGAVPKAAQGPVFAELPVVQASNRGGIQPMITVHTGGVTVDLYAGADTKIIETIIQTLRSC